jgi:hypothetical protein
MAPKGQPMLDLGSLHAVNFNLVSYTTSSYVQREEQAATQEGAWDK